jgi:hypothetical protein
MAILNVQTSQPGEIGVLPSYASILTNNTEVEIVATGFLNQVVQNGASFSMPCIAKVSTKATSTSDYQVGWYQVVHVGSNWSLVPNGSPGDVVLPTIANHIAIFTNTTGTLSEDAATAINAGNIQAGLTTGTAGLLYSCPGTTTTGRLGLGAVASAGAFDVLIRNASHAQASTYSIPDCGATTANFIISKLTGTQHITVGGLQVDAGVITSGISTGGQVGSFAAFPTTANKGSLRLTALVNATGDFYTEISNALAVGQSQVISIPDSGSSTANFLLSKLTGAGIQHITSGSLEVDAGSLISGIATGGTAGALILYPATTTNGSLRMVPVGNVGNFNTTISDVTGLGQTQVITVPDVGAATGQFLVKSAALVSGNVVVASGTAGKVADGGFAVKANTTAAYGGGGTSNAFTATGLTTSSIVTAVILTSTNAVAIAKAVPTANTLTVTFSADPGAATTVSWIAITPAV